MMNTNARYILVSLALVLAVQGQDQSGFISLDCGLPANSRYTESSTSIDYISDAAYINSGESKSINLTFKSIYERQLQSLRSFPQGTRNCYNISNIIGETKYLVRASFLYGNYDGLSSNPIFDLYFGDTLWATVEIRYSILEVYKEIIHIPSANTVQICLINTGTGTPFISALEFRPLPNDTYPMQSESFSMFARLDMGSISNVSYRYPYDVFDRIWNPYNDDDYYRRLNTSQTIDTESLNVYQPAAVVMGTAITPKNASQSIDIWWKSGDENTEYYIYLHFAELVKLQPTQFRGFNISHNGDYVGGPVIPGYLSTNTLYSVNPLNFPETQHNFSFSRTENSTLPPILNAVEIYFKIQVSELESDHKDVDTMQKIKSTYGVTKDWQGDPCIPKAYTWSGVACTNEPIPRITTLNLSSSGLTGDITPDISNLEALEILDLSNNSLTGKLPEIMSKLTNLKVLKLNDNKLTGSVPSELVKRFSSSSFEGNPNLEYCKSDSCNTKKKSIVIPIVASIGGLVVVVIISIIILWIVKKPKNGTVALKKDPSRTNNQVINETALIKESSRINKQVINDHLLETRKQFTYLEVLNMTNNFDKVLGRGGFGIVYYGVMDNTEVAVKILSQASSQGYQQFQTEVTVLLRVYHKNLTNLVGYLNEEEHLGLIYEFMTNGNLAEHLSDKSSHVLSWKNRLRIAIDAAQGLEYLHDGCKRPIIHRDVKTTNILLTETFEAKLADFGLSKSFPTSSENYISTIVAGTLGYLDPEYLTSNRLTKKSDVYSFGVVLLEIISGRSISGNEENVHISKWVRSKVAEGDINGIIDERLMGKYDENAVWKAVRIGLNCVQRKSGKRPWMSQVVAELKSCLATAGMETTSETQDFYSTSSVISLVLDSSED